MIRVNIHSADLERVVELSKNDKIGGHIADRLSELLDELEIYRAAHDNKPVRASTGGLPFGEEVFNEVTVKGPVRERMTTAIEAIYKRGEYPSAARICAEMGRNGTSLCGWECDHRRAEFKRLSIKLRSKQS